jgi:hypothetical protein
MESFISAISSSSFNSAIVFDDISSNPLYLHHGDNPGSHMVVQPLNGDNYSACSQSMIMALTAKNKIAGSHKPATWILNLYVLPLAIV